MMKKYILLFVLVFSKALYSQDDNQLILDGRAAFFQANLEETLSLFKQAYESKTLDADKKSEAARKLGTLYWR